MERHPVLGVFLKAGMILMTYEQASATERQRFLEPNGSQRVIVNDEGRSCRQQVFGGY